MIEGTRIEGYGSIDPSLGKLTQPMVDTPQAITTITRAELDDRAVTNLNDALRTVPGITLGAGETSFQGNNIYLRGFLTRNDMFVDGQRDYGYYYRDPFNTQDVEVLKGPASILFGRGSTGGVINQVTKSPMPAARLSGTGIVSTAGMSRATLDLNSPVSALGTGAAFRLNVMADHTEIADRDTVNNDRWGVAPSLALGLGTPTRLTVSYLHQNDNGVPDYGIPWFAGRPAPVARSNYYGFSSDYLKTEVNAFSAGIEHDISSGLSLSSRVRYSHDTRRFRYTEAVIPVGTPATTPVTSITVNRSEFQGFSTDTFLQNQTDLTARFSSGAISHALVSGFEIGRESPKPTYVTNTGIPTTNLADPQDNGYSHTLSYTRLNAKTVAKTVAFYVLDTVELGANWQIMGGLRWDRFDANYHSTGYNPAGAVVANTAADNLTEGFSYRGAVVYKPAPNGSVYASYGNSFNPSAEGIESLISAGRSVGQANLNLDAEKSRNYEVGSKWAVFENRALLSAAFFRLEKSNVRVPNPATPGFNTLGGNQRVDGAEVELTGEITAAWKIRTGYTYLDSQTTRSATGGPLVGKPLVATPRHMLSLFTEYRFAPFFEAGIGVLSVSSRLGQNTAALYESAPGYTTFTAMGKYICSSRISLQLNVDNLSDKRYTDQLHNAHVVPGEGRSARLSINVNY
ncbi:MAG: TonB-dependent siderophore receptor [Steroidobacteraceae bacterium]